MNLVFVIHIQNLFLTDPDHFFDFGDFIVTQNEAVLQSQLFHPENFIHSVGLLNYDVMLKSGSFIIFKQELTESNLDKRNTLISPLLETKHALFSSLASLFWLLKDCSVYSYLAYLQDNLLQKTISNTRQIPFTKCDGSYSRTISDRQELEIVRQLFLKQLEFYSIEIHDDEECINDGNEISGSINKIDYSKTDRIFRALTLLDMARSKSFLPIKISLYVAHLECLFVRNEKSIKQKFSDRISKYLQSEYDDLQEVTNRLKEAYKLRSSFLHGDKFLEGKGKRSELISHSSFLDEISRNVLLKILDGDAEKFNQEGIALEHWYSSF